MGQIIYYLTRYYSSTGSAAAALIVSIKQPPLSLSVSNYAIIGFLLSSTQLRKTLDFCYHGSVLHAGMWSYGLVEAQLAPISATGIGTGMRLRLYEVYKVRLHPEKRQRENPFKILNSLNI